MIRDNILHWKGKSFHFEIGLWCSHHTWNKRWYLYTWIINYTTLLYYIQQFYWSSHGEEEGGSHAHFTHQNTVLSHHHWCSRMTLLCCIWKGRVWLLVLEQSSTGIPRCSIWATVYKHPLGGKTKGGFIIFELNVWPGWKENEHNYFCVQEDLLIRREGKLDPWNSKTKFEPSGTWKNNKV